MTFRSNVNYRKFRRVPITAQLVIEMMITGAKVGNFICHSGLPPDSIIFNVRLDPASGIIMLYVQSESFEEVKTGEEHPEQVIEFRRHHFLDEVTDG